MDYLHRLVRPTAIEGAVYSKINGSFDNPSCATYLFDLVQLLIKNRVKVRVLDLFDCAVIDLDVVALATAITLLDQVSDYDHIDTVCVQPDAVPAIMPLIRYANENCKHRFGFVTQPRMIDKYRPPLSEDEDSPPVQGSSSITSRVISAVEKAAALGIELDDDLNSQPAVQRNAEKDFEQEMNAAPSEVAASYSKILSAIEVHDGQPGDAQYNVVFEETVGESATRESFGPALMGLVKTGQLTSYLRPLLEGLLAQQSNSPEEANKALLKISRILLLYTKLVPLRVQSYVLE